MDIFKLVVLVCILNAKGFGKAVAKIVAGAGLKGLAVMHQRFYCIGSFCPCKFLLLRLAPFHHRDCQHFLTEIRIDVQHLLCPLLRLLGRGMGGVPFLPQKLPGTQKGPCLLFPANHTAPLIINSRQIPVRMDISLIKIAKQGFRSGPYTHSLCKRGKPAMGHPGHLRRETLHMVLFLLQKAFRNKHRHIYVFHSYSFEPFVQPPLDIFPDCIACRLDHHAPFYIGIINQFRLGHYVRVPLGKIFAHGCDCFY